MNWIKGPISMGISYACYEIIERCFGVSKLENCRVCKKHSLRAARAERTHRVRVLSVVVLDEHHEDVLAEGEHCYASPHARSPTQRHEPDERQALDQRRKQEAQSALAQRRRPVLTQRVDLLVAVPQLRLTRSPRAHHLVDLRRLADHASVEAALQLLVQLHTVQAVALVDHLKPTPHTPSPRLPLQHAVLVL